MLRPAPPELSRCERWLWVNFDSSHSVRSWAVIGGGTREARSIVWHRVSDHALNRDVDPSEFLKHQIETCYGAEALSREPVGFLTGALLRGYTESLLETSGLWARCIATVGLNNALRVGDPPSSSAVRAGTINILLQTSIPVSNECALEAFSLVAEARTIAVLEGGVRSTVGSGVASGTGTDCIAIASPIRPNITPVLYAGKHTTLGHLIGATTYDAVTQGVQNELLRRGTTE
jgi:adenosylcobinamide amidohydrolase